ncbi:splicing factor, CC1-like protein [Amniculicola lignicola CBS 123094]|uniref:Splicing factor, CC1-like protein n=1 Tax=Amniculicola lignicola CBS 123094 TaxID=1392246 RepID=A0A6A5W520_9PLEO|nr:splicing factor, CC1-like protein [Amniculicola lignicola CBS 123094]
MDVEQFLDQFGGGSDSGKKSASPKAASHRDREPERRRSRSRDRYRPNRGEDRYRRSSRDRERDRRRRDNSRPRSSQNGAEPEGSRRSRSRSPPRHRRESPGRYRDRDYDRGRNGRRESNRTPEVTEDDRDKRTVFVQQIAARAKDRHLKQFFEVIGNVVDATIVTDRLSGRSKGVGYVEFAKQDSVVKALDLTGQKLKGVPIIVQLTESEKNRAVKAADGVPMNANNTPFHRLFIGNVHFSVTESDLQDIFNPFGTIESVGIATEKDQGNPTAPPKSRGYGYIQFKEPEHAKAALAEMNGFEVANRQIRVGLGNDKFTPESTNNLLRNFDAQAKAYKAQQEKGSQFSGAGGRGAYAGGSGGVFDRAHGRDNRGVSGASALDDTDVSGVNFANISRHQLMAKLNREPEEPKPAANQTAVRSGAPAPPVTKESNCIKIQNAFIAEDELGANGVNWKKEIEEDVRGECAEKYGDVVHIAADPNADGDIYVKFKEVLGARKAFQGLNGRTFNFRTIRASYVVPQVYNSMWPH